jgi:predicted NBD/HSP70 family sugar kinase
LYVVGLFKHPLPVVITNDANAAALRGDVRGNRDEDYIVITLGTGGERSSQMVS